MPVVVDLIDSPQAIHVTVVTHVPPVSTISSSDAVDFFRVLNNIWRRRALVLGIGAFFAAIGLGYCFIVTPEYETSTVLRPVPLNELDALNRSGIYSLPPVEALKRVGATLDSYDARLAFFRSRLDLIDAYRDDGQSLEQGFEDFNRESLALIQPDPKKADLLSSYVGVRMRYERGVEGAAALNDFVAFAIERERSQLSKDFQVILTNRVSEVDAKLNAAVSSYQAGKEGRIAKLEEDDAVKKAELNDELKALRVQLKLRREARLAQLNEAISIAKSLGLKKPSTPSLMAGEGMAGGNVIRTEVNSQAAPLYFLGAEVLEAERSALSKRVSDDFVEPRIAEIRKELVLLANNRKVQMLRGRENESAFLEGIESLRAERARLLSIDTQLLGLRLVDVDRPAVTSTKPIKPRKALVVLVAFFAGLMLGVLVAALRGAFKNHLRQARVVEISGSAERVTAPEMLPLATHGLRGDERPTSSQ